MRKIKINLEDLVSILEQMRDSGGTTDVIIFDHEGMPAICDVNEPDNIIAFSSDPDFDDEEILH